MQHRTEQLYCVYKFDNVEEEKTLNKKKKNTYITMLMSLERKKQKCITLRNWNKSSKILVPVFFTNQRVTVGEDYETK